MPEVSTKAPVAIEFSHVTKCYKLYKNDQARVLGLLSKRVPYQEICANDDLSFVIHEGESVAFMGPNGAGKSTALKLITGVIYPTEGNVVVNGRVSALLELTAGFDGTLTGRENIFMRGQIWGMSREKIDEIEQKVIDFAGLGPYIDQPMRTYSSGMKARLGFAFSSSVDSNILVVDEALSVGDKKFAKKCKARVNDMITTGDGRTVLFVTHSLTTAQDFCERGIVIESGRKLFDGPIEDAIAFYESRD